MADGKLSTYGILRLVSHSFYDYVPDVMAFKKLDFKKADSYVCEVDPTPVYG